VDEEIELEKPRIGFARDHARKAIRECLHCFPEGFPSSIEIAVPVVLPGYNLFPLNELPKGLSAITLRDQKLIGYNQNHAPVRIRFSVAHEIGHIRLEHPDGVFDVEAEKKKACETEANAFAGEFLVPLDSLKSAFKTCRDCNELAKKFSVSREVMWIRFQDARLLNSIL
jgi:hypothetical protein